jgi:SPP1 gp7 family putative phage head morphogenesis protein
MSHPWSFFTWLYAKFAERVRQAEIPTDLLVGAAPPVLAENVRQDEEKDDEAVEGIAIGLEPTAEMRSAMAGQLTRFLLGAETGIPPDRIPALLQQIQDDTIAGYRSDRIRKMLQTDFGLAQHLAARVAAQADSLLVSKWRELRARDAGCTRYNWSTSHDERVCPRCRALQGKIFSWDNPPEGGHPGECECWRLVCPDYAKVPVGRLDSRCPNCEVELPRRPRGKTKCRSCKKSIWVRTNSDGQQVLLSEEMLADFDRQKFGPEICRCMAMPILE